tara:strand:- start:1032 stop:1466 length:435 start_codon:yes stop_codon:yes gene_type:complete
MNTTKKYPSKVSYGLLSFIFLIFYGPLVPLCIGYEFDAKIIGILVFQSFVYAFILHLFLKTEYSIDKAKLTIKCGVFSYQPIDIQQIKEVSTTKSLISSPAPSFDRIQINYGKFDEIIISPRNKFNFIRDLIKINPAIKNNLFE